VEFAPSPRFIFAVSTHLPFTLAKDLQPRGIYQQMRDLRSRLACELDLQLTGATTESRVVRHGQRDVQEMENGRGKTLSLAKGKMKELTNCEQSQYCRVSILERRASAARFGSIDPRVNDRLVDPEGKASATS